ncbi:hypothetical protein HanIR_Chr13g0634451 [Helianthus annuus]|nr:hypothetical protein HanIR_Chr13g0634451 [Helianthus annuus]
MTRQTPIHIQTNKNNKNRSLSTRSCPVKISCRKRQQQKTNQHGAVPTQHGPWSTLRFAESEIVQQVQSPRAVSLTHGAVLVQDLTSAVNEGREYEDHGVVPGGHGAV